MKQEEITALKAGRCRSPAGTATGDDPVGRTQRYNPLLPADLLSAGPVTNALKQITHSRKRKCCRLI